MEDHGKGTDIGGMRQIKGLTSFLPSAEDKYLLAFPYTDLQDLSACHEGRYDQRFETGNIVKDVVQSNLL